VIANRTCATLRKDENAHKISSENLSGIDYSVALSVDERRVKMDIKGTDCEDID
jgi:hypothetical protein